MFASPVPHGQFCTWKPFFLSVYRQVGVYNTKLPNFRCIDQMCRISQFIQWPIRNLFKCMSYSYYLCLTDFSLHVTLPPTNENMGGGGVLESAIVRLVGQMCLLRFTSHLKKTVACTLDVVASLVVSSLYQLENHTFVSKKVQAIAQVLSCRYF